MADRVSSILGLKNNYSRGGGKKTMGYGKKVAFAPSRYAPSDQGVMPTADVKRQPSCHVCMRVVPSGEDLGIYQ